MIVKMLGLPALVGALLLGSIITVVWTIQAKADELPHVNVIDVDTDAAVTCDAAAILVNAAATSAHYIMTTRDGVWYKIPAVVTTRSGRTMATAINYRCSDNGPTPSHD